MVTQNQVQYDWVTVRRLIDQQFLDPADLGGAAPGNTLKNMQVKNYALREPADFRSAQYPNRDAMSQTTAQAPNVGHTIALLGIKFELARAEELRCE